MDITHVPETLSRGAHAGDPGSSLPQLNLIPALHRYSIHYYYYY